MKYTLITPARNEEAYLEKTIQTVIAQTILPQRWVIVSDGSTDRTDEIAGKYAAEYDFIQLIANDADAERNFGSKSKAIEYGYKQLSGIDYDYIGNLDADVAFAPNYYEQILTKFEENPKLGVAGGIRYDLVSGETFEKVMCAKNSVGGPFQLFRRECYEKIGGYLPLKYGGVDAVAETMARMHGWQVQSFDEYRVNHFRRTGTAGRGIIHARFRAGIKDYLIGYHPLFQLLRGTYHMLGSPFLIGGAAFLSGYFWAALRRLKRPVSDEFVSYLRTEQMARLRGKNAAFRL
ncbi:MAG: glycosyltransferase [Calditrichia bacterium]